MIRYGIWVTFFLAVQLSSALGRNQFYEYYYSKYHHKSHSTTTALSSSTAEISTEQKTSSPVSGDDDSLESTEHSSTVDFEPSKHRNRTSHSYGYTKMNNSARNPGLTIGIVLLVLFTVAFIIACCWKRGYRREVKGIVLSNNDSETTRVLRPGGRLLNQAVRPDYTLEPQHQCPPYYQSGPLMSPTPTIYQHCPESQIHGVPRCPNGVPAFPPPPYDAPLYEAPPLTK